MKHTRSASWYERYQSEESFSQKKETTPHVKRCPVHYERGQEDARSLYAVSKQSHVYTVLQISRRRPDDGVEDEEESRRRHRGSERFKVINHSGPCPSFALLALVTMVTGEPVPTSTLSLRSLSLLGTASHSSTSPARYPASSSAIQQSEALDSVCSFQCNFITMRLYAARHQNP